MIELFNGAELRAVVLSLQQLERFYADKLKDIAPIDYYAIMKLNEREDIHVKFKELMSKISVESVIINKNPNLDDEIKNER
jgi:hypothetical protein